VQEFSESKDSGGAVPRHAATDVPHTMDLSTVARDYTAGFISKGLGFVVLRVARGCVGPQTCQLASTRRCVSTHVAVLVQEREDGHKCPLQTGGSHSDNTTPSADSNQTTDWYCICTHLERVDVHIDVKGHLELKELALAVEARHCTRHIPRSISTLLSDHWRV
jgi:hypothetical protein